MRKVKDRSKRAEPPQVSEEATPFNSPCLCRFYLAGYTAVSYTHLNDATLALGDLINTDKALSVIMAIFVSVAIAFFFGMLVPVSYTHLMRSTSKSF